MRLVSPFFRSHWVSCQSHVLICLPFASRQSSLEPNTPVAVMVSLQMTPLYGLCMKPATEKRREKNERKTRGVEEAKFHRLHSRRHSTRRAPSQTAKPRPADRPSSSREEGGREEGGREEGGREGGVINFPFVSLCRLQNRN